MPPDTLHHPSTRLRAQLLRATDPESTLATAIGFPVTRLLRRRAPAHPPRTRPHNIMLAALRRPTCTCPCPCTKQSAPPPPRCGPPVKLSAPPPPRCEREREGSTSRSSDGALPLRSQVSSVRALQESHTQPALIALLATLRARSKEELLAGVTHLHEAISSISSTLEDNLEDDPLPSTNLHANLARADAEVASLTVLDPRLSQPRAFPAGTLPLAALLPGHPGHAAHPVIHPLGSSTWPGGSHHPPRRVDAWESI